MNIVTVIFQRKGESNKKLEDINFDKIYKRKFEFEKEIQPDRLDTFLKALKTNDPDFEEWIIEK